MLTGDENIVDAQLIVQFMIKDAEKFLFGCREPEKALRDSAEVALRGVVGENKIEDTMTKGRMEVQVATAAPLEEPQLEALKQQLGKLLGAEVVVKAEVDPSLIGGLVVRVGDTVYDGSVANQLAQLRQQMVDRSAHEIQSRRDRFRDPAGD